MLQAKQWHLGTVLEMPKISLQVLPEALKLTGVIMMSFPHLFLQSHLSSCQLFLYPNNNEYTSSLKLISPA